MFTKYSTIEVKIFEGLKSYFKKLPASVDDYKNAFDDLIAQYGFGGEEYVVAPI